MVAVVVLGPRPRKIRFKFSEKLCVVSIGKQVSGRRLKKALSPFGSSVIFAENLSKKQTGKQNYHDWTVYAENLLFSAFLEACYLRRWEKVGVVFDEKVPLLKICELLKFCSSLLVANADFVDEEFLHDCIRRYGTCPDLADTKELYSCDAVFCARPFYNFDGWLFGPSGFSLCNESVTLPLVAKEILSKNVDAIKFAAALSEEDASLKEAIPKILSFGGQRFLLHDIPNLASLFERSMQNCEFC